MNEEILVLVDDGHGEMTPGKRTPAFADGSVIKEHQFNQPVATKLVALLKHNGLSAHNITQGNADVTLPTRVRIANALAAIHLRKYPDGKVIFISVHYNAMSDKWSAPSGVETYNYHGSVEGKRLAGDVHSEILKGTVQSNRGVKEAGYYVIKYTSMPAILVELGFMSNIREASLMLDQDFQYECASEICEGVKKYFNITESAPGPLPVLTPSKELGYSKLRHLHNNYLTDVHIYKSNKPPEFVLGTPRKYEPIQSIASKYKDVKAIVNANLFPFSAADQAKSPLGYGLIVTDNGAKKKILDYYQNSSPSFVDLIAWKNGNVTIETVASHAVDVKRLSNIQGSAHFGASGSYALKIDGKDSRLYWDKVSHANAYTDRTMVGMDADNNWYLIVAECNANSKGLRATDQVKLCNDLNLTDVVNFDGGGSSAMMVKGKFVTKNTGRSIPAAFICR